MALDAALSSVTRQDRDAVMNVAVNTNGALPKTDRKLVSRLKRLLGADGVLTASEQMRPYAYDQCWLSIAAAAAGSPLSRPDVVVRPRNVKQVSQVLQLANALRVPVTPWGGGSGVQGAAVADRGGIVLDLRAMNKIRRIDKQSMTATVEAGMYGVDFENELNKEGLTFTHYPASIHLATIGGYLAARGSGVCSSKYGKIEDHVLNIEGVLPTGEIIDTVAVPRHAMGPELTQLFIGSEGALGVITAVTVKIRQQPAARDFAAFSFSNVEDGIEAGRRIMVSGLRPPALRLYDKNSASMGLEKAVQMGLSEPTLVMTFESDFADLAELEASKASEICRQCRGKDLGPAPAQLWWDKRYVFYYPPHSPTLPAIWGTLDVVMDYAHAADVYHAMYAALQPFAEKNGLVLTPHFSHWYEWGTMIYARFKIPQGPADYRDAVKLHDAVFKAGLDAAFKAGAVLNDHHGVGVRCAPYMEKQLRGSFEVLKRIKKALDPNNIMCPGKLGLGKTSSAAGKKATARRKVKPTARRNGAPKATRSPRPLRSRSARRRR